MVLRLNKPRCFWLHPRSMEMRHPFPGLATTSTQWFRYGLSRHIPWLSILSRDFLVTGTKHDPPARLCDIPKQW